MTPAHGRELTYRGGCRCEDCRRAHRAYLAKVRNLRGERMNQPVGPVLAHLARLRLAGMSVPQIVAATGVSDYGIRTLLRGDRAYVRLHTARAILAVEVSPRCRDEFSGVGAARRLWALSAMGWPQWLLEERCGIAQTYLAQIARHPERVINPATHRRIAALYAELSMRPGPSERAKRHAARKGYPGPLCWDDESIDDPNAVPDFGERAPGITAEDVAELAWQGETWEQAAQRLGVTVKGVERCLYRADRRDVVAHLTRNTETRRIA